MSETREAGFQIAQIFLGRAALEHVPEVIQMPANTVAGEHAISIVIAGAVAEDGSAGIATVRVETTPENKGCYRFMLEMVGMVERVGDTGISIRDYIAELAPIMMYPFVREAVANLTGRGRFGPVWLRTVNFTNLEKQGEPTIIPGDPKDKTPTS